MEERYVHIKGEGKARLNWWREGKMGVSYFEDPNSVTIVGHEVLSEDDDRIEFRYGFIEPDEVRSDIRTESFEQLKEALKERRYNRVHANAKKSTSSKKSQKPEKSSKSEEEKLKEKLENLSGEEKELLEQMLDGEG